MKQFDFAGHEVSRIFKGNWQLAGGHGAINKSQVIKDLITYVEHGVNVFDVGDIYTGTEELMGIFLSEYRKRFGDDATRYIRIHTKFVPDLDALATLTKKDVRTVIERSLQRMGLKTLHLVQFHWWDYAKGDFVQVGHYLEELRREGLIETIGLTNFDCAHTKLLLDAGVSVKSNQVQFSLLDPRPFNGMLEFAQKHNIAIFCYGVLAGGLLSTARPGDEPTNRSHIKYQLIIDEIGDHHYQTALQRLHMLAKEHHTTTANIATAFALQTPGVSSVIVGPRNASHMDELDQINTFTLDDNEYGSLTGLLAKPLEKITGDIYSYERDMNSKHGDIMKYNLNGMRTNQAIRDRS
jgi:aryl-alcohol dehydrogenase-like predicted oxidoreductase